MENEDAVKDQAEKTASPESAPEVEQPTPTQSAPAGELTQPEKKVSESVPYERFKEVNDRLQELESTITQPTPPPAPVVPNYSNESPFDEETQKSLDSWYVARRESEKEADFRRRHDADLKDPIVAGTTARLIAESNAKGQYLDQEEALSQAKDLITKRLQPQVEQASQASFEEGRNTARTKELLGAVGSNTRSNPEPSDDQLSAEEFAQKYQIPRV